MTYCIGLTGGIGSGKSTVANMFREQGITVIDSDTISHQLTQAGGTAIALIGAAFGENYITADGALDRAKMRKLVFSDPAARKRLEDILHPMIRAQMLALAQAVASSPYALLVVPLLFEARNYRELVQRVLVADCSEEIQILRAMQRSSLSESEVRAIMAQQISRSERLALADDVIRNDGSLNELAQQVLKLHRSYLDRSSERFSTHH
jgi:dephospho-CoA kinase